MFFTCKVRVSNPKVIFLCKAYLRSQVQKKLTGTKKGSEGVSRIFSVTINRNN
jgi:hypothetical protein